MKSRIMKSCYKPFAVSALGLVCWIGAAAQGLAISATQVYVDPSSAWIGYMNWSPVAGDAPGYGGTGSSAWGTADLPAVFSGSTLTLSPNVNTYNASDPYWVNADGSGANVMDANMYVQDDTLGGYLVNFQGTVLSFTLVSPYTSVAFVKDFAPDYSSFTQTTYDLSLGGNFSISLATTVGDHIQYGFETVGPNANPATVASLGSTVIQTVPEPSSLAFIGLALAFPFYLRKLRRK